jgi:RNA polymerase sigma factor (sigma-70 family)
MAKGESPAVFRDIHTLFRVGTSTGLTDAQLLDRFRARSDLNSSEAAFAGLMARHGPMVLGVCRRALRDPDDVADAFQATFLILVRKADTVRVEDSLGRWLYGVSRRVSVRAKLAAARRSAREVREIEFAAAPAADADFDELRELLDEEIGRLPEKFRRAVVLCELEGCGHDEAARQLGCAVGTVKSRLSRAREKLRSRLIRRGVAPTAWTLYVDSTSAAVPAKLIDTTFKAAIGSADGIVPPAVTLLIQGVLKAMLLKKLSTIAITVIASLALATSAGVWARQAATLPPANEPGGQLAQEKAGVAIESGNTARSTATDLGESKEQEDELTDRTESLQLDIELLRAEVISRKDVIDNTNNNLIQAQLYGRRKGTNELLTGAAKQSEIESLQKSLQDSRKEYLLKKKEFSQRNSELMELKEIQRKRNQERYEIEQKQNQEKDKRAAEREAKQRTANDKRGARKEQSVALQPAASDAPAISPILEQRLSGIEGKLDNVLKALEDLKRKRSE